MLKKYCILLSEDLLYCVSVANSVYLDEMQHYAAFHLGFHCLQNDSIMHFLNTKS